MPPFLTEHWKDL